MGKKLALLVGASAIALVGMATVPQPASAGRVGIEVGPGGVYVGPRHRDYYDKDDWSWRHRHHDRGAWYEGHRRYHDWD
jgi:hypothetical protein